MRFLAKHQMLEGLFGQLHGRIDHPYAEGVWEMSAYDFIDTLAVQILTYKKEHNETATQFAKGCGVSAATIRRIENGDANV